MKARIYFFIPLILIASSGFAAEISGTVFLSTPKGKTALRNVPLRLHVYKENYEFSGVETMTDRNGKYKFHDLKDDQQYSYLFYPIYQNVNYPYEEVAFDKTKRVTRDFVITESTGSTEDISLDESIYFDFGQKDVWKITHDIKLTNRGDTMYHADRPDAQPLSFPLFEGGFDLSYLEGISRSNSKIDDEKDIMRAMMTLPAHETTRIKFSYYYVPTSRHVAFNRNALLSRSNVSLFFGKSVRVVSNQFQIDPMMGKLQKEYGRVYTSGPIAQNQNINFEIKGLFLHRDLLHIVVLSLCLAFLIVMVFFAIVLGGVQKNSDKQLTQKMQKYLLDLEKKYKAKKIDVDYYKKEEYRVRNFLFQMSKTTKA